MPRQRAESRHGKDHIIVVWPKVPISFSLCQRDVRCLRMLFGRRDLNAQKTSALVIFFIFSIFFPLSFWLALSVYSWLFCLRLAVCCGFLKMLKMFFLHNVFWLLLAEIDTRIFCLLLCSACL